MFIIWVLMLMIPVADLYHCITGFREVVFGWLHGEGSWPEATSCVGVAAVQRVAVERGSAESVRCADGPARGGQGGPAGV